MSTTTRANAEAVHEHMDAAHMHLVDAVSELRSAIRFAEHDYPGNDEVIQQLLGAARLLSGSAAVETSKWWGWSRAREDLDS